MTLQDQGGFQSHDDLLGVYQLSIFFSGDLYEVYLSTISRTY